MRTSLGTIWLCAFASMPLAAQPTVVFTPARTGDLHLNDARVAVETVDGQERTLVTALGKDSPWPGIRLKGPWPIPFGQALVIDMQNVEDRSITLTCRLDRRIKGENRMFFFRRSFRAGERVRWTIAPKRPLRPDVREKLFGMRYFPGNILEKKADALADTAAAVEYIRIYANKIRQPLRFAVYSYEIQQAKVTSMARKEVDECASGKNWREMTAEEFFPMIDKYGQFKHENWPGKIHGDEELRGKIPEEEADLKAHPRPADRNHYGGWTKGPQLEATGHFRVEKLGGKWWLVDPEGRLFWSHGPTCVRAREGATPITDREHLFEWLPPRDGEFGFCYGKGNGAPFAYYKGKKFDTFVFNQANLYRKYGADWERTYADLIHRRLSSWGMNTIANWSSSEIYRMDRTPYTVRLWARGTRIEGSKGHWGKFPDPFSSRFKAEAEASLRKHSYANTDPWCIGFFVNNELSWGNDGISLAKATVASPATQPAKIAMRDWLRKRYADIAALSRAWQTEYADWDAMLASTTVPTTAAAETDLKEFYSRIADKYFSTIHEAIRRMAPNKLDMGCRFSPWNDSATRAAAKYCDVVSYNLYRRTLDGFALPEGVDKPVIVGEFHFGTLVRGMFYPSLIPVPDQEARRDAYVAYIESALKHPAMVGAHWFQFGNCATTGRSDGANAEIGLVDGADTPFYELLQGVRQVGGAMYTIRFE